MKNTDVSKNNSNAELIRVLRSPKDMKWMSANESVYSMIWTSYKTIYMLADPEVGRELSHGGKRQTSSKRTTTSLASVD